MPIFNPKHGITRGCSGARAADFVVSSSAIARPLNLYVGQHGESGYTGARRF